MNATDTLTEAFANVGKEYGYDTVNAGFSEFREFKIKWTRSLGWADFEVTDYVEDAPQSVMEGLAETIFMKISRKAVNEYPKAMMDWLITDDFVEKKRPTYLMRSHGLTKKAAGNHIDLGEAYGRLADQGLTEFDDNLRFTWTKEPNRKRVGYCSILMKVITVSSVFDTPEIPTFVSDYVLYHELIHMSKGFDPYGQRHDIGFLVKERLYERYEEAEEWLKRLRINIRA